MSKIIIRSVKITVLIPEDLERLAESFQHLADEILVPMTDFARASLTTLDDRLSIEIETDAMEGS